MIQISNLTTCKVKCPCRYLGFKHTNGFYLQFGRWSLLIAGIGYGAFHHNRLSRKENKRREREEQIRRENAPREAAEKARRQKGKYRIRF